MALGVMSGGVQALHLHFLSTGVMLMKTAAGSGRLHWRERQSLLLTGIVEKGQSLKKQFITFRDNMCGSLFIGSCIDHNCMPASPQRLHFSKVRWYCNF